jgi:hypothetical protein
MSIRVKTLGTGISSIAYEGRPLSRARSIAKEKAVFAAFKIIATIVVAALSVIAAIAESTHPLLFTCLVGAFVAGAVGAEIFRSHRSRSVRSQA